jgi:hypothetical protein
MDPKQQKLFVAAVAGVFAVQGVVIAKIARVSLNADNKVNILASIADKHLDGLDADDLQALFHAKLINH